MTVVNYKTPDVGNLVKKTYYDAKNTRHGKAELKAEQDKTVKLQELD